jgi:death-on-curing family protein
LSLKNHFEELHFMKQHELDEQIIIYQTQNGAIELKQDIQADTVWASQSQIAEVFEVKRPVITKHIRNILNNKELDIDSVCSKMERTGNDGKKYQVQFYNLDIILAVGYRVNSKKAMAFRRWATQTLKQHITKGYTINRDRVKAHYEEFLQAVADVKSLLPPDSVVDSASILELITLFADTWFSLDAYDKDKLAIQGTHKEKVELTAEKLQSALIKLKQTLIAKEEATDIFGLEREKGSLAGIVGNVMQSFADEEMYPSIEEKAAHLLYFIIKNHPFVDGNKRSGAYAFIWFLNQTQHLDLTRITPAVLTTLTLLIAESNPKEKDKMIGLVCNILVKR